MPDPSRVQADGAKKRLPRGVYGLPLPTGAYPGRPFLAACERMTWLHRLLDDHRSVRVFDDFAHRLAASTECGGASAGGWDHSAVASTLGDFSSDFRAAGLEVFHCACGAEFVWLEFKVLGATAAAAETSYVPRERVDGSRQRR